MLQEDCSSPDPRTCSTVCLCRASSLVTACAQDDRCTTLKLPGKQVVLFSISSLRVSRPPHFLAGICQGLHPPPFCVFFSASHGVPGRRRRRRRLSRRCPGPARAGRGAAELPGPGQGVLRGAAVVRGQRRGAAVRELDGGQHHPRPGKPNGCG